MAQKHTSKDEELEYIMIMKLSVGRTQTECHDCTFENRRISLQGKHL